MRTRNQRKWTQLSRLLRLEDRVTPAIYMNYDSIKGEATVTSDAADSIEISSFSFGELKVNGAKVLDGGGQPVRADAVNKLIVNGGPGANVIDLSGVGIGAFPGLARIFGDSEGGGSNKIDPIKLRLSFNINIQGGGGNDVITGSAFADFIDGGAGIDVMKGGRGNDFYIIDPGETCDDGGTSTGDGVSISLNGLPPGTPLLSGVINHDTNTHTWTYGTQTWITTGIEKTFFDSGNFASALGQCTVSVTPQSSNPAVYARVEFQDVIVSHYKIDWSGPGDEGPEESITFVYGSLVVNHKIQGSNGNDTFDISPGRNTVIVDGGAGNDSVFVNHGGYSFTQPPGTVQVAGRAPVLHSNVETVEIGREFSGDAAIADLKAKGVTVALARGDVNNDGQMDIIVASIKNQSAMPVTDVFVNSQAGCRPGPNDAGQYCVQYRESDFAFTTLRVTGNGLTPTVDPNPQGTPVADLIAGEYPYAPRISFAASSIPANSTATGSVQYAVNIVDYIDHDDNITAFMQLGGTRYRGIVLAAVDSYIYFDIESGMLSLAPTGKSSTLGASTLSGVSSNGAAALMVSAASDLDSSVTNVFPGTHVYVNNVTVDTSFLPNSTGDGQSYGAAMDAAARFVAFTTDAKQLVQGVQDVNPVSDVYFRDMMLGTTKLLSGFLFAPNQYMTGNGASFAPQVSADGHYVYFLSNAPNLITGLNDTNNATDLFRYDTATSQLKCMSTNVAGTATGNKGVDTTSLTGAYSISGDGLTVSWMSQATDLVPGGSPAGNHIVINPRIGQEVVVSFLAGTMGGERVGGDGNRVAFWTTANLSALTGVPDTNGVSDLFMYDVATNKVRAWSVNSGKTAMGNGATPANLADGPAVDNDDAEIVFCSNATDLLPGAPVASNSGVYIGGDFDGDGIIDLATRIDKLPGGGYGGDNHEPAISPNGRFVGFTSKTNYAAGGVLAQAQAWVHDSVYDLRTNVSLDAAGQPGASASQGIRFAENGGQVLFQTQSKLTANDTNNFVDVYGSVAHLSLSYTAPTGNGADDMKLYRVEDYLKIDTIATVASRPLGATRHVFITGANGEDDTLTVQFDSGLAGVGHLTFLGGTGAGTDKTYIVGGQADYATTYLLPQAGSTAENVELHNGVFAARLMEEEGIFYYFTVGNAQAIVDLTTDATMTIGDNGIANDGIFRVTRFAPYSIDIDGTGATSINFVMTAGNDIFSIPGNFDGNAANTSVSISGLAGNDVINVSGLTRPVTLIGGAGSDTLTGGSGNDLLYADLGADMLNGGAGDDRYYYYEFEHAFVSSYAITDPSGRDTLDFSAANFGVNIDYRTNAPQIINGLGGSVQLVGQFERFIGSGFSDHVTVGYNSPFPPNSFFDVFGELQTPSGADTFTFDANGKAASASFTTITCNGQLVANFDGMESIQIINVGPPPCIAPGGVTINGGDARRSRVTTVKIDFDQFVTLPANPADAFQLKRQGDNAIVGLTASVVNDSATHVTLTFTGANTDYASLQDGRYTLTVIASKAYTTSGQLDGDCNGTGGDNYVLASASAPNPPTNIYRIFGDYDGDGTVAANDFIQFRLALGGTSSTFDFDGDGAVAASDFIQFRLRFGGSI